VPRSVRRLALLKALSSRIIAGDVLIAEQIKVATPKT
jgi:ribosomal protein L4